jgi:hypothetical protein
LAMCSRREDNHVMRWVWSLGSVLIVAVAIGWSGSPALGWFAGLFGSMAVLFAWRAGVAGDTSRRWARELYGSKDRDGSDYASIMGRRLGRPSGRGRRGRGAGRST